MSGPPSMVSSPVSPIETVVAAATIQLVVCIAADKGVVIQALL